jgi:type III restriction enzyme
MNSTKHLIINNPYEIPKQHLKYIRESRLFEIVEERRSAGYVIASGESKTFDDPGIFIELPFVNQIRLRVNRWRDNNYPGITNITRNLLERWHGKDSDEKENRFFFCQLEAIETMIWFVESPENEKQGLEIKGDGGNFTRLCSKMATGTGKTVVMAMLIAWNVLNKVTYPKDNRFSKNILIVAPGLTVKSRLKVLLPSEENNYYNNFDMLDSSEYDRLRQARIKIINWHMLSPLDAKSILPVMRKKMGKESDEAYVKRVLGNFSDCKNILVINDEAHHAWRTNIKAEGKHERISQSYTKEDEEEATIWIEGLDKINNARQILRCHDFSATPFAPSGKRAYEETLFPWIVSDFGLNDAIESGLVKTPRVVIRDDGKLTSEMKSRFYHIYMDSEVKTDINRKAEPAEPLPDLINNAYYFLGLDWLEWKNKWEESGQETPPVMITVCNRTETAARIENAFTNGKIRIGELTDKERTLRIDSKVIDDSDYIDDYESYLKEKYDNKNIENLTPKEKLRLKVDTVGKVGQPGEKLQNIIAVNMLSEGWDAKTVTHIMGLRAFTSQLLCEQVVGRGLRRISYEINKETNLLDPEYVNIFGVPFTFLPHEGGEDTPPPTPKPKTRIYADPNKKEFEIKWPNIIRINHCFKPRLSINYKELKSIELRPEDTPMLVEIAPVIEGKPDVTKITDIRLEELGKRYRKQTVIFEVTRDVYDQMKPVWSGNKEILLGQLVKITEEFIDSKKMMIKSEYYKEEIRKNLLILLNMNKIVQHLMNAIIFQNSEDVIPVFDKEYPIKSTEKMISWNTSKPCELSKKSHVSHVVLDSTWEASEALELDRNKLVHSWVKNDHLGFFINYVFHGVYHKYYPDFLIKMTSGKMLILEVKGLDNQQNKTKRQYLDEWIKAVNNDGRFGKWNWDVSFRPSDIKDILTKRSE